MSDKRVREKLSDYQTFLIRKHKKFTTPTNIINKVVEKATGSTVATKKRLILGEINEVYDITTKDGQNVIARVSRSEGSRFEAEKWAIEQCKKAGVPVPTVLFVDKQEVDGKTLAFSIEKKIDGEQLLYMAEFKKIKKHFTQPILIEAGKILSQIHSIRTKGFGKLNINGVGHLKSWKDFIIYKHERKLDRLKEAARNAGIKENLITKTFEIIKESRRLYSSVKPCLLHGDLGPKHFLIKDKHIVGVLDFESCKGGDPVYEFARYDYFYGQPTFDWLKEAYNNKKIFKRNFDKKLNIYKLHLSLSHIDWYESEKNEPGMNHTKKEFKKAIKYFK